jgi:RNA polymerase sigma-70 factor (ECF subfamily)
VRRKGKSVEDAEDLTQGYFARFLEKDYLSDFRPEAGRFRSFILASVSHFLSNEWDRQRAQKRGGGQRPLSLETRSAESRLELEPVDHETPESLFEREWVAAALRRCLSLLRKEQEASGVGSRFEVLKTYLAVDGADAGYAAVAAELGTTEAAARVAVHRLRKRFRAILRAEVARTVKDGADVEPEIRWMLGVVRGGGQG